MRMKKWLTSGGDLVRDKQWIPEIKSIRFRRNERSKIQIMSKREMRKEGFMSPNTVDALMLTFSEEQQRGPIKTFTKSQRVSHQQTQNPYQVKSKTKNNLHSAI